jgi:hypothetical protein
MDRRPNRNPGPSIALVVVAVLLAIAIAVLFDAPTSVFLLVALVIAFGFLTMYSSRGRNR